MRQFLQKLGFRRLDEMERSILFRAQRNAYLFLAAALFIWSLYESCQVYLHHSRLNLLPCLLLTAASIIQALSQQIMTRRAVKDDEDSCETGPLVKIIALLCAAASIAVTAAAAILLLGVQT